MTKKDYEAIAAILRRKNAVGTYPVVESIMEELADLMYEDNPRFDRTRFVNACRGEDYKGENGRTSRYSQASR